MNEEPSIRLRDWQPPFNLISPPVDSFDGLKEAVRRAVMEYAGSVKKTVSATVCVADEEPFALVVEVGA